MTLHRQSRFPRLRSAMRGVAQPLPFALVAATLHTVSRGSRPSVRTPRAAGDRIATAEHDRLAEFSGPGAMSAPPGVTSGSGGLTSRGR